MAITEAFSGSGVIDHNEWSLPRNALYHNASGQTTAGVYQVFLDTADLVSGDELQIRIYEKVRTLDTQRIVYQSNLVGPQSPPVWVAPSLVLMNGWDVTTDFILNTGVITWSIRKVA